MKQAMALHEAGKFGEAAALYRDILIRDPGNGLALHLLALVAMQFDNAPLVLALSEQGLQAHPHIPVFHQDRATALRRLGRKEEAMEAIAAAIAMEPKNADFLDTKAAIARDLRRYDDAVAALKAAIALDPGNAKLYNNLGICLGRMGANDEALHYLDAYIAMKPDDATGYNNKANTLKACRRYDEAIAFYDRALALNPDIFMGKANKGIAYLVLGNYPEGWELFEYRRPGGMPPEAKRFDTARRWHGETDPEAALVLYHEQGLGDTLQFCRYAGMAAARVGRTYLQVQPPLQTLLKANFPELTLLTAESPLPDYSRQCPLMSLPHVFGTTPATVPLAGGYLKAPDDRAAYWRTRLPQAKRRIGLVWAGNPDHLNDHIRSIPLAALTPLLQVPDCLFVSLQKGGAAEQLKGPQAPPAAASLLPVGDELQDFSDTASLMMNLDLLITVDTSVLHLAGALGRPAWAMLQFDPDWRWLLNRDDTPWYSSVRLFRQEQFGDWNSVIARVADALART